MSPDKLEKYILDHREQFDDLEPDPAIWDKIDTRKAPVVKINWKGIAWKVAAAVIIFIGSYFFHDYMTSRYQGEANFLGKKVRDTSPIVKELFEAEAYYTSQINIKKEEVFRLTASNPEVRQEVDNEMVDLDRVFKELKDDLKDDADNQEVIEAMIQNYRLKLDILEEMLNQLQQYNKSQNKEDDENKAIEL